jgi:hypothetical protein
MDNSEILIPDGDNLVAQAELLLAGNIEFDAEGFHITPKGFASVWDYLRLRKKLSSLQIARNITKKKRALLFAGIIDHV